MYFTRILLSIVFVLFGSIALAAEPNTDKGRNAVKVSRADVRTQDSDNPAGLVAGTTVEEDFSPAEGNIDPKSGGKGDEKERLPHESSQAASAPRSPRSTAWHDDNSDGPVDTTDVGVAPALEEDTVIFQGTTGDTATPKGMEPRSPVKVITPVDAPDGATSVPGSSLRPNVVIPPAGVGTPLKAVKDDEEEH